MVTRVRVTRGWPTARESGRSAAGEMKALTSKSVKMGKLAKNGTKSVFGSWAEVCNGLKRREEERVSPKGPQT
eukprot:603777-Pelagomonas_calceolata.AAC.1